MAPKINSKQHWRHCTSMKCISSLTLYYINLWTVTRLVKPHGIKRAPFWTRSLWQLHSFAFIHFLFFFATCWSCIYHPTLHCILSFLFSFLMLGLYYIYKIQFWFIEVYYFDFIIFLFCKDEVSRKRHLYIKTLVLIKDLFSFDHKKYRGSSSLSLAVTQVILQFWYYNNDWQ